MKNRRSNKFAKAFCFCRRKCSAFCQIICSPPFLHTPTSHNEVQKSQIPNTPYPCSSSFQLLRGLPSPALLYWLFGRSITQQPKLFELFRMGMKRAAEGSRDPLPLQNIFIIKKIASNEFQELLHFLIAQKFSLNQ